METKKRNWLKEFFGEKNEALIIPIAANQASGESALGENCQKLLRALGLPSFEVKAEIAYRESAPAPYSLLFAADFYQLYDHDFLSCLLKAILCASGGDFGFMRGSHVKSRSLWRGDVIMSYTEIIQKKGENWQAAPIEKAPYITKKIKVILEVLNRCKDINLKRDTPEGPLVLMEAAPPTLEAWHGLYKNAAALVEGFMKSGALPTDLPEPEKGEISKSPWFEDEVMYSVGFSSKNSEAGKIARRVMLDAGLSCGISAQPEILAFNENTPGSEYFYWDLLKLLRPGCEVEYAAMSRGYEEVLSYSDVVSLENPLPGLNGAARVQVVTNALQDKHITFNEYLGFAGRGSKIAPQGSEKASCTALSEILDKNNFLMACLPLKLDRVRNFPGDMLAYLCIDAPFINADGENGPYQIFFPHYYDNYAISRENYLNLMVMLSMLLEQNFLLLQNGSGTLFKINTDPESGSLGEIEKIGAGPAHEPLFWQEMLEKTSGRKWKFLDGTVKGKEIPFIPAGFLNRSPAHARRAAREALLNGPEIIKKTYKLPGSCKNALLHERNAPNYLFYKNFMAGAYKKLPESFFEGDIPTFFMDISTLDEDKTRELTTQFRTKGCLVCIIDNRRALLAKPLFSPRNLDDYWQWLQKLSENFIGMTLGRAWFVPLAPEIDEIYEPLGFDGRYVS